MQKDMHFYGVYALARAAGIKPIPALTIAHSSQFVDDATENDSIIIDKKCTLPAMTSHKTLDLKNFLPGDQWNVWVPFHFLPGNSGDATSFEERMVCIKDSDPAKKMLEWVCTQSSHPYTLHLAGIAAHVYADTFSHHGFVGLINDLNKIKDGSIDFTCTDEEIKKHLQKEKKSIRNHTKAWNWLRDKVVTLLASRYVDALTPLGHGPVADFPDRPYLTWSFKYETYEGLPNERTRDNLTDFLLACEHLFYFFQEFAAANPDYSENTNTTWNDIKDRIYDILKIEARQEERITTWKDAIKSRNLFQAKTEDLAIDYESSSWQPETLENQIQGQTLIRSSDPYLFTTAAHIFRDFILNDLLPDQGILERTPM